MSEKYDNKIIDSFFRGKIQNNLPIEIEKLNPFFQNFLRENPTYLDDLKKNTTSEPYRRKDRVSAAPCGRCGQKNQSNEPYDIIVKCHQSPGDITLLSAALREIIKAYPGKFNFVADTFFPEIFFNSPIVRFIGHTYNVKIEDLKNPVTIEAGQCWQWINERSDHLIQEWIRGLIGELNKYLKINLPEPRMTEFKGDIYLTDEEKNKSISDIIGDDLPYWVVDAGYKTDYTCKRYPTEHFQSVVDGLLGKVRFVQIGRDLGPNTPDIHPPLKNVINLIGKTENRRDLMRVIYHSDGVVTPISWPMHLAAALPKNGRLKPCVVLGGGRESTAMIQYPGHTVLSMVGKIDCALKGACLKVHVEPRIESIKGPSEERCLRPENGVAKCMRMITPSQVIVAIESYLPLNEINLLPSKICIATLADDGMKDLRELTFPNKKEYAEKHGYGFVGESQIFHEKDRQDRPAAWSKLPLILKLMSDYEWIFWSDADSVITNPYIKLESLIDNNYEFIVTNDQNGMNTGEFIIKSTEETWRFLRDSWERTQFINNGCWEQSAMGQLLNENPNRIRTKILPQKTMNSYPYIWTKDDFICHAPRDDRWPNKLETLKNCLSK